MISITDDESVDAYQDLGISGKYEVSFMRGVEVGATYKNSLLHLLAYGCDFENERLKILLETNQSAWDQVGLYIIELLSKVYPELSLDEYVNYNINPRHGGFKYNSYLYWLRDTSVRKNGSLAVANVLVLISFLLKRYNSNRGRSKEHLFPFFETTTKKLASEGVFLVLATSDIRSKIRT